MSRVAASSSPYPSSIRDFEDGAILSASPTLRDLLGRVSDGDVDLESPRLMIPFAFVFENLTYSVKVGRRDVLPRPRKKCNASKTILDDVSGEVHEGEIMAVMGASGSGKSTLIDALANRIEKGSLKGRVTLNREKLDSRLQKAISAYVMQDDLLFPTLTVEETLTFAAEFRLPRTLSKSQRKTRVQSLIDQLGLRNATNTLIGDEEHGGVSGGERRRVSIGVDIIHNPILLFLDEPTSGLDSTSAFMVVKVLRRIAMTGSIIIMSIHQPSHRIIQLLDRMIFLSLGKIVYTGTPSNLPRFFSDFGRPIPHNENWTDHALDVIREMEDNPKGTENFAEFNKSQQSEAHFQSNNAAYCSGMPLKEAIASSVSTGKLYSDPTSSLVPKFTNPPWIELAVLLKRSFTNFNRSLKMSFFRVITITVTAIILATMFLNLDDSVKGIQERLGFFAFTMSAAFYTCADALPVFLQERYIFMRETAYNAYRRSSYVVSITIVFLPVLLVMSSLLAFITFWAVGLKGSFYFYFLIIFASYWAGNSFVTFLSAVVPQVILGYIALVALLGYSLLLSGFFMNRNRIPDYWIWLHYISLIKYPYEGVLKNEFQETKKCFISGIQMFDGTPLGDASEAMKMELLKSLGRELGVNITATTCVTSGGDILRHQGVSDMSKWECLWVTVAWGFFFRMLFYLALLVGSKNKRR